MDLDSFPAYSHSVIEPVWRTGEEINTQAKVDRDVQPQRYHTQSVRTWPERDGEDFEHKTILKPLEPFHDKMLVLKKLHNKVRGDGDNHMRGMSCLLTGIELFPGNVMGGGNTPSVGPKEFPLIAKSANTCNPNQRLGHGLALSILA